ncbi:RimL Acetyltransferases, including N-acetylases of ribosomal proteins [Candidatus Nanopelagicaceae bacterium]
MLVRGSKMSLELRDLKTSQFSKDVYLEWLQDFENNKYIQSVRKNYSMSDLDAYLDSKLAAPNVEFWGIFVDSGRFIGTVKLDPIDTENGTAWLGIMIGDVSQRGKGYGRMVLQQIAQYSSENLNLKELFLGVHKDNLSALKLYAKQGFQIIETNEVSFVMKKDL